MNLRTAFKAIYLKTSCNRIDEKKKNEFGPPFNRDVAGGGVQRVYGPSRNLKNQLFLAKIMAFLTKKFKFSVSGPGSPAKKIQATPLIHPKTS